MIKIEKLTFPQVESLKVKDLKEVCKQLGLSRYSSLTKPKLVELVWEASAIEREKYLSELRQTEEINNLPVKPVDVGSYDFETFINTMKRKKYDPVLIARMLLKDIFKVKPNLADSTLITHYAKDFKDVLIKNSDELNKECEKNVVYWDDVETFTGKLFEQWNILLKPIRLDAFNKNKHRLLKAKPSDKTTFDSRAIIEWSVDCLKRSNNPHHKAYAFSLLTGRRSIEVLGRKTVYRVGELGIQIKGIAKKPPEFDNTWFEIVPLTDKTFLVDFINSFDLKGKIEFSKTVSKQLERNKINYYCKNINKFKDCRDFYAATINATLNHLVNLDYFDEVASRELLKNNLAHNGTNIIDYYKKFSCQPLPELEEPLLTYYYKTLENLELSFNK